MAPVPFILPALGSPLAVLLLGCLAFILLFFVNSFLTIALPKGVALVGEPPGATRFSHRTLYRYYTDCSSLFREVYHEYAKKGKAVVIPGIAFRTETILPVSSMRWVMTQPDNVLSVGEAFADIDQAYYSLSIEKPVTDAWHGYLVKKEMNAVLENIVAAMNDELGIAFDKRFGTDPEWREVDLLAMFRMVVAQAASRFTVGLLLRHDEDYLLDNFQVVDSLVVTAGVNGGMPQLLKPIVGRLVGIKTKLEVRKIQKHFEPLYKI